VAETRGAPGERIVVTGLGAVTPLALRLDETWRRLLAGESGIAPVTSFDASRFPSRLGAEVHGFDPQPHLRRHRPEELGRASQLAVAAARQAIADAGVADDLDSGRLPAERVGVAMGTTSGEPREVEELDDLWLAGELERLGPGFLRRYPCHGIASAVAAELGAGGPVVLLPTACAAGNYAVARAFDTLRRGRADLVVAGGADAFSRITYTGFARLGAIAPERCQPFDKNRKGMVPGEGAAALVLETLAHARARGARVLAEVAGYGLSCDAHHMTAAHPEGDGPARAMEAALAAARLAPEAIGYVSAHGTGTPTNDKLETLAVHRVFGERGRRVPVSSIKSMLGHTMGAASAIEAAVCCLVVAEGRIPPTTGYEEPDPACDLDVVPNAMRETPVAAAMNNAYAFGGNNAAVIFRRVDA
jgi:3-oxoacyl-[acyl-carrier-protein] synthase II